ncbi:MAG: ABC transporter substrate-binding protein, partial [Leifsonia sp.]
QATASTIAGKFKADNVDLVLAIATPTAQAAAQTITNIPILFTAVTEPKEAGLVTEWDAPGANVTGTSDLNPVKEQLQLITDVLPDAKTVGVIYSSGEVNSDVQVKLAKDAAKEMGLTIKEATVTVASEVSQAAESLGAVDAIYIPTDNKVTEGIESVIQFAEAKKIPLFGAEGGQVESGAIATYGIDYTDLGYQTGKMAVRILKEGADPATMPVETLDKISLIINTAAAKRMGVTIPAAVLDKADKVIE